MLNLMTMEVRMYSIYKVRYVIRWRSESEGLVWATDQNERKKLKDIHLILISDAEAKKSLNTSFYCRHHSKCTRENPTTTLRYISS